MKHDNDYTIGLKNIWEVVCYGSDGKEKWRELNNNLVVTVGLNAVLTEFFKGSSYTATWCIGLKGTGTPQAADTMASHSTWSEDANYTESARPTIVLGTPSSGSVDNTASKANFSINGTTTLYGAFLVNSSTKSGTSGVLYGVVDFGSSRAVISGDTLIVTVTLTAASA